MTGVQTCALPICFPVTIPLLYSSVFGVWLGLVRLLVLAAGETLEGLSDTASKVTVTVVGWEKQTA